MLTESIFLLVLFIFGLLVIWVPWLLAHKIRPYFGRKKLQAWLQAHQHQAQVKKALKVLQALYKNTNPFWISKASRLKHRLNHDTFLYGEILPLTFIKLLDIIKPGPEDIFYDLGSGAGKAVLMADMCYPFQKVCGIEYLPALYNLAAKRLERYQQIGPGHFNHFNPKAEFRNEDFLEVDFTEATIIFVNATAYKGPVWDSLVSKLKKTAPGTHIIVTTFELNYPEFKLEYQAPELMSWGFCSVRIYKKIIGS